MEQNSGVTRPDYEVLVTPCIVTRQFNKCIRVPLAQIEMPDGKTATINGNFSRDGLTALIAALDAVDNPLDLPSPEEVKSGAVYMWGVVMKDGEFHQQYQSDGSEKPFKEIHIPDVEEFWIIPRRSPDELPWYGVTRFGWRRKVGVEGALEVLDSLPFPHGEDIWFQYERRLTIHFGVMAGQADVLPPRTVQVLGWRSGERICEIGIEEDGNWQVWRMEPADDPRWKSG